MSLSIGMVWTQHDILILNNFYIKLGNYLIIVILLSLLLIVYN